MMFRTGLFLPVLIAAMVVSGCGGKKSPGGKAAGDPALGAALADPIMVDPDLVSQNKADAAIAGGGRAIVELPPFERSPDAIAAAKDEAAGLAGGDVQPAPVPSDSDAPAREAVTAAQLAQGVKGPGGDCPGKLDYAMNWPVKLPQALPVYPRGHVVEAAGSDRDGCQLRVVRFVAPVDSGDLIDFYYTRAKAAGYSADHRLAGDDHVLSGSKGHAVYRIETHRLPGGLTEAGLVTNGG